MQKCQTRFFQVEIEAETQRESEGAYRATYSLRRGEREPPVYMFRAGVNVSDSSRGSLTAELIGGSAAPGVL